MKSLSQFKTMMVLIGLAAWLGTLPSAGAKPGHDPKTVQAAKNAAAASGVKNIGVAEFEKLRADKKHVVLDVRTPKEFEAGHVPGAINIDWNAPDFEKKVKALDHDKAYLVHCAAGVRSSKASAAMAKLQFKHLFNLEGGFKAWEKAGHKADAK